MSVFTFPSDTPSSVGDVLVAHVLEVKQHERNALVIRQLAAAPASSLVALVLALDIRRRRARRDESQLVGCPGTRVAFPPELAEEPPSRAIAREVVEARVPRHGLQPAGGGRARADLVEALKRPQKHGLRDVLGLRRAAAAAGRRWQTPCPDTGARTPQTGPCRSCLERRQPAVTEGEDTAGVRKFQTSRIGANSALGCRGGPHPMRTLRAPRRLWLVPDWSNWVLMAAIVLLVTALAFYFTCSTRPDRHARDGFMMSHAH